jgi:hypothetical protein
LLGEISDRRFVMSRRRVFLGLMIVAILIPGVAAADVSGAFRADVSALGMGNTGIAVPGRGCLWHYNPALLNTFSFDLCIPSIDLGMNGKTVEFFDFLEEHQDDFKNWDDLEDDIARYREFEEDARDYYRKPLGFRIAPLVGFATRNFGLAVFANTRADVVMLRRRIDIAKHASDLVPENPPQVLGLFRTDVVAQLGTAGVAMDPLALGINIRYVNRRSNFVEIRPDSLDEVVSTMTEDTDSFHGWAVDLGAYYPTGFWNLSLGANVRNLLGKMQVPDPQEDDPDNKKNENFHRNVQLGAAWKPFGRLLLTADVVDVFQEIQGLEWEDQVRFGAELDMLLVKFRTGLFGSKVTYGAGLNLLIFKIDFATYVPEFDRRDLTDEEERIYVGQVKVGW